MAQPSEQTNTVRPPVIAIMGHIDHGKSTLLDYIRKTNITDREAGGITQHVSAYEVRHPNAAGAERIITFLDTPGHAAFSGIRERGVKIADIAILVVSAEDGAKPQTVEAWKAIQDAKLPYIVALNKIDRPDASIDRTKASLAENGIYVEGYGGDVPSVAISAKTGQGVDELLDMVNLVGEMQEFTGDTTVPAEGFVLESNLDAKKGVSATLIIKNGTLSRGQTLAAGGATAPVRIMENFLGAQISEATFSSPVRIIGWDKLPSVGDAFKAFSAKTDALAYATAHAEGKENDIQETDAAETERAILPVIIKADVAGSLEAIVNELKKLSTDKVRVKPILTGIGTITENDLKTAEGSPQSVIIAFNAKPDATARNFAMRNAIDIHSFDIIYKLTEWLEELVKTRTPKVLTETTTGSAKILKFFSAVKDKQVVGARVESGEIKSNAQVKIMRRDAEIGRGRIRELQHNKTKTGTVSEGQEFGMQIDAPIELAPGDKIECFEMIEK